MNLTELKIYLTQQEIATEYQSDILGLIPSFYSGKHKKKKKKKSGLLV